MHLAVEENVYTRRGKKVVWLEPGDYPILRIFDKTRVLVDCSTLNTPKRQLTVLDISQGTIINDSKEPEEEN